MISIGIQDISTYFVFIKLKRCKQEQSSEIVLYNVKLTSCSHHAISFKMFHSRDKLNVCVGDQLKMFMLRHKNIHNKKIKKLFGDQLFFLQKFFATNLTGTSFYVACFSFVLCNFERPSVHTTALKTITITITNVRS